MNYLSSPANTSHLNTLFDDFFGTGINRFMGRDMIHAQPSVNILEDEQQYQIQLAVPGIEKEDFTINVENGFLSVSATSNSEPTTEEGNYKCREFNYSTFKRRFRLPKGVDTQRIEAAYDLGVLNIRLPKLVKEEPKTYKIEIS